MTATNHADEIKHSHGPLLKAAVWTVGAYGFGNLIRFGTNVILSRLLAPELFGLMLIVNTLRTGLELVSDVGIGQNIIFSKNGENPEFYNTAWTLQIVRGLILWIICVALALPAARFYHTPNLIAILPVAALVSIVIGFSSIRTSLLRKRMQIARLNTFDMIVTTLGASAQITVAYASPTIWALVFGSIIATGLQTIGSYFLLPGIKQKLLLSKQYAWEILHFGKWIYVSSFVYFLSMNFDRLYLAKIIPLALLGVYGIARNISDLSSTLVSQLGSMVVFPFISSSSHIPRYDLRKQLASIRLKFLLIASVGLSFVASTADLLINTLYDQRYHSAGWMLSVLIIGTWFSILSNLNEATLLGFGKPNYGALGNTLKFAFLLLGLLISVPRYGVLGGVMVVGLADLWRYIPIYIGQHRQSFSFARQDLLVTLTTFGLIAMWEYLRHALGFGTSFDAWMIGTPT